MDKKSVFIWGAVVLILAGIAAAVYFYIKKQQEAAAERAAEAERKAAEAAALAEANLNLIEEQTNTLQAVFPTEPNIQSVTSPGDVPSGLTNYATTINTGLSLPAVEANSTGGRQLIDQTCALLASNAATWRQAINRANAVDGVFANITTQNAVKIKQILQTRLGWSGQDNDFPIYNKYTQLRKYNDLLRLQARAKADTEKPWQGNYTPSISRPSGKPFSWPELYSLNEIGYSPISDSGQVYNLDRSYTLNGNGWSPSSVYNGSIRFIYNWASAMIETDIALTAIAKEMLLEQKRIYFSE